MLVSTTADHWIIQVVVWSTGVYVAYVATEKYEECIFDKPANKMTLRGARFLEKAVFGYRRLSTWLWWHCNAPVTTCNCIWSLILKNCSVCARTHVCIHTCVGVGVCMS